MSFSLSIQSAPEWRGDWTPPSAWSGAGTARPVITGRYSGRLHGIYQLTVASAPSPSGSIGISPTLTITWLFLPTPPTGSTESGRLDVGTDSGYVQNKKILFHGDLMIHFPSGTLVQGNTCTFNVTAARRLPRSFHRIAGTANPADVSLLAGSRSPTDALFVSDIGDVSVLAKRRGHAPTLQVIYQDNAAKRQLEHMEGQRQAVMLGEHYDKDTVFLLRGGGTEPLIGSVTPNGRASLGTYWDHRSGQFRRAAAYQPRTSPGVQFEAGAGAAVQDRYFVPLRYKHIGRALRVSAAATTNIIPNSHPTPLNTGWLTQAGTPTVTFQHGILGVLDPNDPAWPDGMTQGVVRIQLDNTEAVQTDLGTIAASAAKYMVTLWVRGRGNFLFEVYGGVGVANTLRATLTRPTNYGTETDWQRIEGEVTSGATDTRLAIRIRSTIADGIVYVAGHSIVRSDWKQASLLEPSTSSIATRSAETYTIADPLPEQAGTLQLWFQDTGDDQNSAFPLVDVLSGARFAVRVNTGIPQTIQFHTDASGSANSLQATIPATIKIHEWHHVAVTWNVTGATGTQIFREIYIDGVSINSDSTSFWDPWGLLSICPTVGVTANDWCIQELRIDKRVLTAAEILDSYQRFTLDRWIHIQRMYWGREFRIGSIMDRWRHPQLPDVLIAEVSLLEAGVHENSLVGDP